MAIPNEKELTEAVEAVCANLRELADDILDWIEQVRIRREEFAEKTNDPTKPRPLFEVMTEDPTYEDVERRR